MKVKVEYAQLAASSDEDRIVVAGDAVVVLDGATAHDPEMPAAGRYVDLLADKLRERMCGSPNLVEVLEDSITDTARSLEIVQGVGPSTTVAAAQVNRDNLEVLVLGDSSVIVGFSDNSYVIHTDDRLSRLDLPESREYQYRLSAGKGYDDEHRSILRRLQAAERSRRNQPDGYWIAEANPDAARHAITAEYPRDAVRWVILASDGAFDLIPVVGVEWPAVAAMTEPELSDLLHRCYVWESQTDPTGRVLPRAKRHDDKTIALVYV
ncbi:PP2C family serine/threonine-protein phosphatase [Nocardia asteroides]|uniref:PP2C family serine/threonine-protein phosphatase n=1 Tax=Nocardia asteroides TaxID=1824 RepID=UPI0037CC0DBC